MKSLPINGHTSASDVFISAKNIRPPCLCFFPVIVFGHSFYVVVRTRFLALSHTPKGGAGARFCHFLAEREKKVYGCSVEWRRDGSRNTFSQREKGQGKEEPMKLESKKTISIFFCNASFDGQIQSLSLPCPEI